MPIPKPNKGESQDKFMDRCLSNETMNADYPDNKQRYAICISQWKNKKSDESEMEERFFSFQLGKPDESLQGELFEKEKRKMVGHAAVFNQETEIGNMFREKIEPGAFKSSIKKDDVRALFNHNPDYVLGRNKSGTLTMSEDDMGLKISIDPPDTDYALNLKNLIARGDINQMSFSFRVQEEEWTRGDNKELDLRTIKKVRIFDVSPVTFPAYEGTDIAMRSHDLWKNGLVESEHKQEPIPQEIIPNLSLRRQLLTRRYL